MKKIIGLLLLGFFLFSSGVHAKSDVKAKSKFGGNLLSFILLSDINAIYEIPIEKQLAVVSTVHYVSSGVFKDMNTDFRASLGLRTYASEYIFNFGFAIPTSIKQKQHTNLGNFLEIKTGLIRLNGEIKPTFEFGGGYSQLFNETIFYEWKLGIARLFTGDSDVISPLASVAVGLLF